VSEIILALGGYLAAVSIMLGVLAWALLGVLGIGR
jgi:hypothetical protein